MPPRNPTRSVTREDLLAERVAALREDRGWTYDGLAARMTALGCPIQPSAIFKTEKGNPRRRVVVDELVAYSKAFDVPLDYLVAVPGESAGQVADAALGQAWWHRNRVVEAQERIDDLTRDLTSHEVRIEEATSELFAALDHLDPGQAEIVLGQALGEWGDELRAEYAKHRKPQKRAARKPRRP